MGYGTYNTLSVRKYFSGIIQMRPNVVQWLGACLRFLRCVAIAFAVFHLNVASAAAGAGPGKSSLEEQWYAAVESGDSAKAIECAKEIVGDLSILPVDAWYAELFKRGGINPDYMAAPFGALDFQRWSEALFFKKKVEEACKVGRHRLYSVERLASKLFEQLNPGADGAALPWPQAVWNSGKGLCDRMSWTLCELAYQAGNETAVVYLIDPATGQSPHTICEIRDANGARWLSDPLRKKASQWRLGGGCRQQGGSAKIALAERREIQDVHRACACHDSGVSAGLLPTQPKAAGEAFSGAWRALPKVRD